MLPLILTAVFCVTHSIAETGNLEVTVQAMFTGAKLDAVVVVRQGNRDYSDRFGDLSGNLNYGDYVLTVSSDGFQTRSQAIGLWQPKLSIRIGLSPGIGWSELLTTVRGRIDEIPEGEEFWVSLTPLLGANSDVSFPIRSLKRDGRFEFPYVVPGHYLLAVVQGFPGEPTEYVRVLHTRYVKVQPKVVDVNISLSEQ